MVMSTSPQVAVQLLFVALALVMAGLGLWLELTDFRRIFTDKRASEAIERVLKTPPG